MSLNRLRQGNLELRDPTDPVVFVSEMATVTGHAIIEGMRELLPEMFPSMAQRPEHLYRHISDRDLIDVFALPSNGELLFYIDVESLLQKAMPLISQDIRRVIIPRDTVFKVAGYEFAIQYPIEIRVLPYATRSSYAFQVLWLTENQSPISPVTTNALDWSITNAPGYSGDLLMFRIPVLQYSVVSMSDTVTPAAGFVCYPTYKNQFYMARVWMRRLGSDKWEELATTLSQRTYNVAKATAVIQVLEEKLKITIPAIYVNKGMVDGDIRVDVYSTMGPVEIDLGSYTSDQFSFSIKDLNGEIDSNFSNPLKAFAIKEVIGNGKTSGGRAAMSFDELRAAVVNNAVGTRRLPVTPSQLSTAVAAYGMEMSEPISYVTGRTLHLSKPMLPSTVSTVHSPIGTVTAPLFFTWDELAALPTARVNGNRITLLPETIYGFDGVNISFDAMLTETLKTLPAVDLVKVGNARNYLFTPFYYVMDINNASISVRAYQLDRPSVENKRFVDTNVSTALSVITHDYQFQKVGENYVLRVLTKSDKTYKSLTNDQVFAQIQYTPRTAGGSPVCIQGELKGMKDGERVFEFTFESNLDIDRSNELVLTNTINQGGVQVDTPTALSNEFNIIYGCTQYYPGNYQRSYIDDMLVGQGRDAIGVTHEVFGLKFGDVLEWYWSSARPVTDSINYKYYEEDVLAFWEHDDIEYQDGVPVYVIDETKEPPIQFKYKHRKGDPVIDPETGQQKIAHHAGSQVKENGQPVIAKPRSIKFMLEMIGYDARYRMANTSAVQRYVESVVADIVKTVTVQLPMLKRDYLELTYGYFRPVTTIGNIVVRKEDGSAAPVSAENRFTIYYYMSAANRENMELLKTIRATSSEVINRYLSANKTVSTTELCKELKVVLGESVLGVEMDLMGPERDMRIFTVLDEAAKATLGKKLDIDPDGSVVIKDDVTLSFNRHDVMM